eukprot:Phypoly_transcript_12315.p1 GENE.Phypoly_transcript_12315~~Phypoly_transcript_12315.p1  ORF type:complete len:214 (-),score=28.34 Phypoly_transcript_12315:483-1124(-)
MDVAIDIDDGHLPVEQLSYQPYIVRVKGFLTEDECHHFVEISKNKLRPCNEISAGVNRTGWGVFLQKSDENNDIIQRIYQRMGRFVPVNNDSEVMQIIRYKEGESTSAHYDFFNPLTPNGAMKIGIYGQRVATVLMYLNNVEEGGTTSFPELNITTKPVKGDAVIFYNCKPNGDPDLQTMHTGDTVLKGTKWLAIKLINQKVNGDAAKVGISM